MRENRTCGSEGGEGNLPDPYQLKAWMAARVGNEYGHDVEETTS